MIHWLWTIVSAMIGGLIAFGLFCAFISNKY